MNRVLSSQRLKIPPVIGHRGACGYAPENTASAFQAAASLGISCVEFDVKLSADGKPVVIHDDTVDRTTSGQGAVGALSLTELQRLDAGSWFGAEHSGATIITFNEAIDLLAKFNMSANVEIKPSPGKEKETAVAVCDIIKEAWPSQLLNPLLSSFVDDCMVVAQDIMPEIERALLIVDLVQDWENRARSYDAGSVHIWHKNLTREQARSVLDAGYGLRSYTVNDDKTAQRLFGWGLESVFSDFPDHIKV